MPNVAVKKGEDRDRRARKVWALLAAGKTDDEAREELGLKPLEYRIARARMLELEAQRIREKPPEEIFLEYSIIHLGLMAETDRAIARLARMDTGSTAYVSAIKAKSDLYDKIMRFGQDLGLIHKRVEEKRIIQGVVVTQLSDDDLRNAIVEQAMRLQRIVDKFGAQSILEMDPGDIHYVLPPQGNGEDTPQNKTNRAHNSKVHQGRRRVRERLQ